MSRITWDDVGSRYYEMGCDRGVLYVPSGAVPWNGLIDVDEKNIGVDLKSYYNDNQVSFVERKPGVFSATISAFTYPREFEQFDGRAELSAGIFTDNQPIRDTFDLSYRTWVGNDTLGENAAYRLHLVYNASAMSSSIKYRSVGKEIDPTIFTWEIQCVPPPASSTRPSAHVVIDSRYMSPNVLRDFESVLYGDDTQTPTALPSLDYVLEYFKSNFDFAVWSNDAETWGARGGVNDIVVDAEKTTFGILWGPPSDGITVTVTTTG